jgi:hypothetical protein
MQRERDDTGPPPSTATTASKQRRYVDPRPSPCRIDALADQLRDVIDGGHRALVFSQFTGFLTHVRERLDSAGVEYTYLDCTTRNRPSVIRRFKDGSAPVFLISLKAGGFGLNLTEASCSTRGGTPRRKRRRWTARTASGRPATSWCTASSPRTPSRKRCSPWPALFTGVMNDGAVFGSTLNADDIKALLA